MEQIGNYRLPVRKGRVTTVRVFFPIPYTPNKRSFFCRPPPPHPVFPSYPRSHQIRLSETRFLRLSSRTKAPKPSFFLSDTFALGFAFWAYTVRKNCLLLSLNFATQTFPTI